MKNLSVVLLLIITLLSACQDKFLKLDGNVYIYRNGPEKQTVGFDKNTVYLKWDDSLGVSTFQSKYTIRYTSDSTAIIELEKKPEFWESNKWDIVIDRDKGFYSVISKKYYKLSRENTDKK